MISTLLKSNLLRDAGLYAIFNGLAAMFPLLVVPLLTRTVAPADYGVYGVVLVAITLVMPLIGGGLETAVGRRFVDRSEIDFSRYVTTAVILSLVLAVVVYGVTLLAHKPLAAVLPLPTGWYAAWIVTAWCQVILSIVLILLQMERKAAEYGTWRVGRTGAVQVLTAVAVLVGFHTWEGLVMAVTLANLALTVNCLLWLRRKGYLTRRVAARDAKDALRYGAPLIPHMLSSAVLVAAAPFFLTSLEGLEVVGIYTVGAQLGLVMHMISGSVYRAWIPWYYAHMKDGTLEARRSIWKAGSFLALGLVGVAVIVGIVGSFALPWFVGSAYDAAGSVFVWSVAAWTAHGLYGFGSCYLFYTERTPWISVASVATVATALVLTPVLIQDNGMVGAAQATFAAYVVTLLLGIALTAILSRKGTARSNRA